MWVSYMVDTPSDVTIMIFWFDNDLGFFLKRLTILRTSLQCVELLVMQNVHCNFAFINNLFVFLNVTPVQDCLLVATYINLDVVKLVTKIFILGTSRFITWVPHVLTNGQINYFILGKLPLEGWSLGFMSECILP